MQGNRIDTIYSPICRALYALDSADKNSKLLAQLKRIHLHGRNKACLLQARAVIAVVMLMQ